MRMAGSEQLAVEADIEERISGLHREMKYTPAFDRAEDPAARTRFDVLHEDRVEHDSRDLRLWMCQLPLEEITGVRLLHLHGHLPCHLDCPVQQGEPVQLVGPDGSSKRERVIDRGRIEGIDVAALAAGDLDPSIHRRRDLEHVVELNRGVVIAPAAFDGFVSVTVPPEVKARAGAELEYSQTKVSAV